MRADGSRYLLFIFWQIKMMSSVLRICSLSTLWEGWRLLLHDSAHLCLLPELWLRELDLSTAAACGKNTCLQLLAQQRQTTLSKYRSRLGNITSHYTQQVSHISYCRKKGTCIAVPVVGRGRHDILLDAYLECLSSSLFQRRRRKE